MTTTDTSSAPNLAQVRTLIAITKSTGLDGRVPGRDVIRGQIRELSGYLNALQTTIATRATDPADRQLRRDAVALLYRAPAPDETTLRQAQHLRQLARTTHQYLGIAERREEPAP